MRFRDRGMFRGPLTLLLRVLRERLRLGAAILAIAVAVIFVGGLAGLLTLIVVLVLALAISYRVVTVSDPED